MRVIMLAALLAVVGCSEDPDATLIDDLCPGGRLVEFPDAGVAVCWEDPPTPQLYTADEALYYCDNLVLYGFDDWVVPDYLTYEYMLDNCQYPGPSTVGETLPISLCNSCADSEICAMTLDSDTHCYWAALIQYPDIQVCLDTGDIEWAYAVDAVRLPVRCARAIATD